MHDYVKELNCKKKIVISLGIKRDSKKKPLHQSLYL